MKVKVKRILNLFFALAIIVTSLSISNNSTSAATSVSISLQYDGEAIPSSTTLLSKGVVSGGIPTYRVTVKATASGGGTGIAGRYLTFNNPNTSSVRLIDSSSMDYNGICYAHYEVRGTTSFTCTASINDGTYIGSGSNNITPSLACYYSPSFYITWYCIAKESEYSGSYYTAMPGVSGTYKSAFVADVKVQGAGYTHNSQYVQYNSSTGSFYVVTYPQTATGTSPTVGKTIAVDPYYVPRLSTQRAKVNILGGVGYRQAEDGGGAIDQFHIDVFMGTGKTGVNAPWSTTYQYVWYYGNNLY